MTYRAAKRIERPTSRGILKSQRPEKRKASRPAISNKSTVYTALFSENISDSSTDVTAILNRGTTRYYWEKILLHVTTLSVEIYLKTVGIAISIHNGPYISSQSGIPGTYNFNHCSS